MALEASWDDVPQLVAARLRELLQQHLVFAGIDEVLTLCCRQLSYGELASQSLAKVAADWGSDSAARDAWIETLCAEVVHCHDVRDCEQLAQFAAAETGAAERQRIRQAYQEAYTPWAMACLRSKLIPSCGEQEAETLLGQGLPLLDARVFQEEAFAKAVHAYRPQAGKRFENFFKQRISWRAVDVARIIGTLRSPPVTGSAGTGPDINDIPATSSLAPTECPALAEIFRDCLEGYRHGQAEQADQAVVARQLAAFELRYKGYLAPADMSPPTLALVGKSKRDWRPSIASACRP